MQPTTVAQPGIRRALDVVGSLILLAVLAPAFVGAAVAAAVQGGPVFASRVLWVRGQRISVLEFNAGEGAVGRFLWLTRLNQLPMLLSVLRGDLSFEDPLIRLIEAAD
jgi:lipopolysaccharide/colanic/teichoic acid biosynthesis glycosyltransferase